MNEKRISIAYEHPGFATAEAWAKVPVQPGPEERAELIAHQALAD